ncbi:MAG TPA: hypothetical protein VHZ78_03695 [Rhizomicrobium sp.]|nr:hypothetical protein [Rhizomicrobium sp.]
MRSPTRIELFGRQSVVSLPVRLHPAYVPHVLLGAVIVLAWTVDAALAAANWVGLV